MNYNIYSNCAYSFGSELYRGCTDGYVNIAIFDPAGAKRFFSIPIDQAKTSAITGAVTPFSNANVFFQVNPITTAIGGHARGALKDVASVPALFADIDFKNPNKKEERLPLNDVEALQMFAPGGFLAPTIIVETGRGLHAYWILEEPIIIDNDQTRSDMVDIAAGFGSAFRSHALEKYGCKFDSTSDLPRLGRLPGTFNVKGEAPLPVQWRSDPESKRYSIEQIADEIVRFRVIPKAKSHASSQRDRGATPSGVTVDEALRRSERQWWKGKVLELPVAANAASMVEGCAFLRHGIEQAVTLSEPEWFDALRLIARTENGEEVAHAMSSPHPSFDPAEVEKKYTHAKSYEGNLTCDYIATTHVGSGCSTCPFKSTLHSPVDLGNRTKDQVTLLANTAYVASTDQFYDLRRISKSGVRAEAFSRMHGGKHIVGKAADVVASDPIAIKAHERAYRPDKGPGTFSEHNSIYLNYYVAPRHSPRQRLPRRFFRHLRYLVPNRAERKVVIRWLALLVQRPWEKLGYSVALIGGQGTGKSYILSLMALVLGADNVRAGGGRSIISDFNGHLAGRVLLGLEEVTITGRAEAYEGLKALITNEVAEFQRKHVDREELATPRGVLVLSNDAYALHLPEDDRRFFVVQTPATKHPGGSEYYVELFKLDDQFVADVYWSLKAVNLDGFNSKTPPFMTAAKARMADYSRADIDVVVEELVESKHGPFARAVATWEEIRTFVRERHHDPKLSDKRIKRALEAADVVIDPQKRQCRIGNGGRPILYLIRCVDEVSHLTANELAALYTHKKLRFDGPEDQDKKRSGVEQDVLTISHVGPVR